VKSPLKRGTTMPARWRRFGEKGKKRKIFSGALCLNRKWNCETETTRR